MKYVLLSLLFCGTREQQQAWEDMTEEARNQQYARAVAFRQVAGPEEALAEVNAPAQGLNHYHLFHAIRGSCCWS